MLGVYDTMQFISSSVATTCVGQVAGSAQGLCRPLGGHLCIAEQRGQLARGDGEFQVAVLVGRAASGGVQLVRRAVRRFQRELDAVPASRQRSLQRTERAIGVAQLGHIHGQVVIFRQQRDPR